MVENKNKAKKWLYLDWRF